MIVGQVVDTVSVVPEDSEVTGSGFQVCKAADSLIRIGGAVGVCVLRNTPDALDGIVVVDPALNQCHIGSFGGHRNVDHLDAENLADAEVTVISGDRAEEFQLFLLAPGFFAAGEAEDHCACDGIVHHVQRRVAADKDLVLIDAHNFSEQTAGFGNAFQLAVVTCVHTVFEDHRVGAFEDIQHPHRQVELFRAGFTAGHIQFKTQSLVVLVFLFQSSRLFQQLVLGHFFKTRHKAKPPSISRSRPTLMSATGAISAKAPQNFSCVFIIHQNAKFCKLFLRLLQNNTFQTIIPETCLNW